MTHIVLATMNARWSHTSFGLRCLAANMGDLADRTRIVEFDLTRAAADVVARILDEDPVIVGFGVYIWNVTPLTEVVAILKRVRPDIAVVIGGPEVSYEIDDQRIAELADYVVAGEADLAFPALVRKLLVGERPPEKVINAPVPDLAQVVLPYEAYTDNDIAHRTIYVEASRGCPFECEFCLSALDIPVRAFDTDRFLAAMQRLLDRGARTFKFVDRTFNLNLGTAEAILRFFLERLRPNLFLHFEMIPDRLPAGLRGLIAAFPEGVLQFEVGVQTLNDVVSARISRRQDVAKMADNLRFLRDETHVHVHADLVLGLPGETLDSMADGFDRLFAMGAQEIQVGILKRLRGTPIIRHTESFGMIYAPEPPYEILANSAVDFRTMRRLGRFAQTWEHLRNSGQFPRASALLWEGGRSPFRTVLAFSDFVHEVHGQTHAVALGKWVDFLFRYLTERDGRDPEPVARILWDDYRLGGRSDRPASIKPFIGGDEVRTHRAESAKGQDRQARHRAGRSC